MCIRTLTFSSEINSCLLRYRQATPLLSTDWHHSDRDGTELENDNCSRTLPTHCAQIDEHGVTDQHGFGASSSLEHKDQMTVSKTDETSNARHDASAQKTIAHCFSEQDTQPLNVLSGKIDEKASPALHDDVETLDLEDFGTHFLEDAFDSRMMPPNSLSQSQDDNEATVDVKSCKDSPAENEWHPAHDGKGGKSMRVMKRKFEPATVYTVADKMSLFLNSQRRRKSKTSKDSMSQEEIPLENNST
jgi:hypothetical protein